MHRVAFKQLIIHHDAIMPIGPILRIHQIKVIKKGGSSWCFDPWHDPIHGHGGHGWPWPWVCMYYVLWTWSWSCKTMALRIRKVGLWTEIDFLNDSPLFASLNYCAYFMINKKWPFCIFFLFGLVYYYYYYYFASSFPNYNTTAGLLLIHLKLLSRRFF